MKKPWIGLVGSYHKLVAGLLIPITLLMLHPTVQASSVVGDEQQEALRAFTPSDFAPLFAKEKEAEWTPSVVEPQLGPFLLWCLAAAIGGGGAGRLLIDLHVGCMRSDPTPLPKPNRGTNNAAGGGGTGGTGSAAAGPLYYGTCNCNTNIALADVEVTQPVPVPLTLRATTLLKDDGTVGVKTQIESSPGVSAQEYFEAMTALGLPFEVMNRNPIHTKDGVVVAPEESPYWLGNGKIRLQGPEYDQLLMAETVIEVSESVEYGWRKLVTLFTPVGYEHEINMVLPLGNAGFFRVSSALAQ